MTNAHVATDNLAAPPAGRLHGSFGAATPASVYDRGWLVTSLAQLGRFAEAAEPAAEAMRLAGPTHHAFSVGVAHRAAATLHLLKGDWAEARALLERGIAAARNGVAPSAWALAQLGESQAALNRLREAGELLERQASGLVGSRGRLDEPMGRACLCLGRLDEARRLADRVVESPASRPGFAAHALHPLGDIASHPDRFEPERGAAHYRRALGLAGPRGMRPLVARCHLGLGRLCRRAGRRHDACEHLATATTLYREMDMRSGLAGAAAETAGPGA